MVLIPDDRRKFDRVLARFPTKIKDSRNDFGTDVFLRDVSAEGARVSTRQKMFIHDSIAIQVKLPDGYDSLVLNGEVVWLKNQSDRTFEVGLKFHSLELMNLQRLFQFCIED